MNRSYVIAGSILAILTLYMSLGFVGCSRTEKFDVSSVILDDSLGKAVMTVRTRNLEAVEIAREVVAPGRTDAARRIQIKARTSGRVDTIIAKRGERVSAGDSILRIELDSRPETVKRAEAALEARTIDYEAAVRLAEQKLTSGSALASAKAATTSAEEALALVRLDMEHTIVRAPFAGVLNERFAEVGDFLQPGDPVGVLLELDPLIVTGEVTELQVRHLQVGEHGIARLSDGREVEGRIRYVDTDADPSSRTFSVELEVPNPGLAISAGVTAEIVVETERVPAYEISLAHVSIDDEGRFGIKYMDTDSVVRFAPVDVVRSTPRTVWLTGLPDPLRLITTGQGFTKPGDVVVAVEETAAEN